MSVRFSCRCPNADYLGFEATPEAIIASAAKAEELGFDAVFVNDHIVVDSSTRSAPWTTTYDPLVALGPAAAARPPVPGPAAGATASTQAVRSTAMPSAARRPARVVNDPALGMRP